jgi:anti-sigma factor RsiW
MISPCADFEILNAFVDGQLSLSQELEVRRHLDGCENCRSRVESLSALKESVASTAEIRPVPHSLRERINALSSRRAPLAHNRYLWLVAGLAAILLIWVGSAMWSERLAPSSADRLTEALVEDHIHYLNTPDGIQVASDDPQHIAESFQNQIGFPIALPKLSSANLLGGRFCWLRGRKALLAFYRTADERFSIFILDGRGLPSTATKLPCRSVGNFQVCMIPYQHEVIAMVATKEQTPRVLAELKTLQARGE